MQDKVIIAQGQADSKSAGQELGAFARQQLGVSSRRLQRAVRTGGLLLNGRPAHSKTRVRTGDRVQVALPTQEQLKIPPGDPSKLKVLYEDEWLLAVDKPSGLPTYAVQDTRGAGNQVAGYFRAQGLQLTPRPVHRLDAPASGVLVFAKDPQTQTALTEFWGSGKVQRFYYAICSGQLTVPQEVTLPLDGQPALTRVEPLRVHPHCTEVRAEILTGRTHQIRRHLSALGHPLLGDGRYGGQSGVKGRLALHAQSVIFPHPYKKEELLTISSPIPKDEFLPYLLA